MHTHTAIYYYNPLIGVRVAMVTEALETGRVLYVGTRGEGAAFRVLLPAQFKANFTVDSYLQVPSCPGFK